MDKFSSLMKKVLLALLSVVPDNVFAIIHSSGPIYHATRSQIITTIDVGYELAHFLLMTFSNAFPVIEKFYILIRIPLKLVPKGPITSRP